MEFNCPDAEAIIRAIDESRVVTALLNSKGGTLALLAAWTLGWEFAVKPVGRILRRIGSGGPGQYQG